MKSAIKPALINDPFGDPGLVVNFLLQKRALLFDLGDLSMLSNGTLLKVSHVFVSHTHIDHFIGFDRLLRTLFGHEKTLTIFGPKNIEFKFKYTIVKEDDVISILGTKVKFNVIETPGHTLDHIIYVDTDHLFCGDTLFACGCGRLFEGTYREMFESLSKISSLAPKTKVYCAHEYTKKNIQFALTIDKENNQLNERYKRLRDVEITIPSILIL